MSDPAWFKDESDFRERLRQTPPNPDAYVGQRYRERAEGVRLTRAEAFEMLSAHELTHAEALRTLRECRCDAEIFSAGELLLYLGY